MSYERLSILSPVMMPSSPAEGSAWGIGTSFGGSWKRRENSYFGE
jgi:hypothetical protein